MKRDYSDSKYKHRIEYRTKWIESEGKQLSPACPSPSWIDPDAYRIACID